MKPMNPSSTLAAVVGSSPMPRTEVTQLWGYSRRTPAGQTNRRMINADDKLREVFGGKKQVSMFEMASWSPRPEVERRGLKLQRDGRVGDPPVFFVPRVSHEDRLTDAAPVARGHYSQAVVHEGIVYVAGSCPSCGRSRAQARRIRGAGRAGDLQRVRDPGGLGTARPTASSGTTVYIADVSHWTAFNAIYARGSARIGPRARWCPWARCTTATWWRCVIAAPEVPVSASGSAGRRGCGPPAPDRRLPGRGGDVDAL